MNNERWTDKVIQLQRDLVNVSNIYAAQVASALTNTLSSREALGLSDMALSVGLFIVAFLLETKMESMVSRLTTQKMNPKYTFGISLLLTFSIGLASTFAGVTSGTFSVRASIVIAVLTITTSLISVIDLYGQGLEEGKKRYRESQLSEHNNSMRTQVEQLEVKDKQLTVANKQESLKAREARRKSKYEKSDERSGSENGNEDGLAATGVVSTLKVSDVQRMKRIWATEQKIFGIADVMKIVGLKKSSTYDFITLCKKVGVINQVGRGKYELGEVNPEQF